MKLKTTVTEEKEIDMEPPFFYCRTYDEGPTQCLAVLNEQTAVELYLDKNYKMVKICAPEMKSTDIVHVIQKWDRVTEETFLALHEAAVQSLSLVPKLHHADDLKDINI